MPKNRSTVNIVRSYIAKTISTAEVRGMIIAACWKQVGGSFQRKCHEQSAESCISARVV